MMNVLLLTPEDVTHVGHRMHVQRTRVGMAVLQETHERSLQFAQPHRQCSAPYTSRSLYYKFVQLRRRPSFATVSEKALMPVFHDHNSWTLRLVTVIILQIDVEQEINFHFFD